MFKDMRLSAGIMDEFRNYLQARPKLSLDGLELNVQILTTGFWPTQVSFLYTYRDILALLCATNLSLSVCLSLSLSQASSTCRLPPELVRCCDIFREFYLSKHTGRRLVFQTNMGTAELRGTFGSKRHEIGVSTQQMCILMLFNKYECCY
jgi:cullin 3